MVRAGNEDDALLQCGSDRWIKDYEQAIEDFLIKLRIFELDRGSSNLVGDFLIELGIQVIRSGIP